MKDQILKLKPSFWKLLNCEWLDLLALHRRKQLATSLPLSCWKLSFHGNQIISQVQILRVWSATVQRVSLRVKCWKTKEEVEEKMPPQLTARIYNPWWEHSTYSKTVSAYQLLSALPNWFKLFNGLFGQSNMHCTLDFFTD